MAQEALLVSQFAVAALMFAVAGLLLWVNFSGSLHRLFALFLGSRATIIVLNQLMRLNEANASLWSGTRGYFLVALSFILIDFWIVFQFRQSTRRRRVVRTMVLGAFLLAETLYMLDHSLLYVEGSTRLEPGPLGFLAGSSILFMAALGLWFALNARVATSATRARFQFLLGLGFAVAAILESVVVWDFAVRNGFPALWAPSGTLTAASVLHYGSMLAALPTALAASAFLLQVSLGAQESLKRALVAGATGSALLLPVLARALDFSQEGFFFLFVLGLVRLMMPLLVGYAILRYVHAGFDPLSFESNLNVVVRRGTLGTLFVAAYFAFGDVLGEVIPELPFLENVNPFWAQVIGAGIAGLLLLPLYPLRRATERLSNAVAPPPADPREMSARQRETLYAEQAEIAWSDGTLTRKERLLLDGLRTRLHIPADTAAQLESRAAAAARHGV